jgi:imidazolonepropionase-like amidohydrolase
MGTTAFVGAHVIDVADGSRSGTTVVISGDRIEAVGPDGSVDISASARTVNLDGRTLMPGMVTSHFHSTYNELGSTSDPLGLDAPGIYQGLIAARNLELALRCGFTGAVSAGASFDIDPSLARAVKDGIIPGPRFMPGGRELSTTGHSNDTAPWYWELGASGGIRICDGAEGFRLGTREEIKRGAKVIKVFLTGGHGTTAPRTQTELTRDELAAVIETAHARGALVRAHIVNRAAIGMALDLGIDIIDHGDDIDDECIAQMVEQGTFYVPSIFFPKHFAATIGAGLGFTAGIEEDLRYAAEILPRANDAGVRLLVGDDYGAVGFPHGLYGKEFAVYVEDIGLPPLDVIRWATVNGAALLGLADELGTITAGKLADIVVVDGDPLADITVLGDPENILAVYKGGVPHVDRLSELPGDLAATRELTEAER